MTRRFATLFLASAIASIALGCGGDTTEPPAGPYSLVTTYAGNGVPGQGDDGLPPNQTALYWPQDITFGPDGKAYILDWNNHRVRVVTNGVTQTLIGTGELGDADDGPADSTGLNHPTHVTFDPQGRLILSAWHNSKVMRMDLGTGMMVAVCNPTGARSYGGDGGPAIDALLDLPVACVHDSFGRMYIVDQANQRIRVVDNDIIDTFAGTGEQGFGGDGGMARDAMFNFPVGQAAWPAGKIAIDELDNIYVPDAGNHRVRIIEADSHTLPSPGLRPAHTDNLIRTIAGTGEAGGIGDGVPATEAQLRFPGDVAVGPDGSIYIADTFNHAVRKVDADGIITTVAGKLGERGYGGDGGHPRQALFDRPAGLAFDANGNLYIADQGNHRIRVVWKNP